MTSDPAMPAQCPVSALIPHSGRMCLLGEVIVWDERGLRCRATSHRRADHPMAREGKLHALCAIEYAAQAMAAHGALTSARAEKARGGRLVGLREVELHARYLDEFTADLAIEVELLTGDIAGVIYRFAVSAGERPIISGRATVILDVAP